MSQHPNDDIDLEERLSYDIVRTAGEGLADSGIVADSVNLSGLETFAFRVDRLVVAVATRNAKTIEEASERGASFN